MEMAHQLKKDMLRRDKEIEALQTALVEKNEIIQQLKLDLTSKVYYAHGLENVQKLPWLYVHTRILLCNCNWRFVSSLIVTVVKLVA